MTSEQWRTYHIEKLWGHREGKEIYVRATGYDDAISQYTKLVWDNPEHVSDNEKERGFLVIVYCGETKPWRYFRLIGAGNFRPIGPLYR